MTNAKLSLNTDTIHYQVRSAVADLSGVENIRLIASALGDRVGELSITAGPEELRLTAAVVKSHSFGVLASLATLTNRAERSRPSRTSGTRWNRCRAMITGSERTFGTHSAPRIRQWNTQAVSGGLTPPLPPMWSR